MNGIEFSHVSKRFGDVSAIDDVSFAVSAGETVALLGPSGCGKTTILRVIAGFETPDAGTVTIGGAEMTRLKPYERNVGLLFQHYALFPHMTVAENVAYGLRHRGHAKRDIPARVDEMLALVRLPDHGRRRPDQLSGGQQQRVALARALATRPALLLLDEPLSALDAKLRQDLRAELKDVLAAVGSTAIVVTHDQEEAMSLGERIFVMKSGKIVQEGRPNEVYQRPRSRFVADFMGRANWFTGRLGPRDSSGGPAFESRCGLRLAIADAEDLPAGEFELCVRPESVELVSGGVEGLIGGGTRLRGRVLDVALLGATRQVVVKLDSGSNLVIAQRNRAMDAVSVGSVVDVEIPADACVCLPSGS